MCNKTKHMICQVFLQCKFNSSTKGLVQGSWHHEFVDLSGVQAERGIGQNRGQWHNAVFFWDILCHLQRQCLFEHALPWGSVAFGWWDQDRIETRTKVCASLLEACWVELWVESNQMEITNEISYAWRAALRYQQVLIGRCSLSKPLDMGDTNGRRLCRAHCGHEPPCACKNVAWTNPFQIPSRFSQPLVQVKFFSILYFLF